MKKHQWEKILKIVARKINSGDFTKLKPVTSGASTKRLVTI
ncbi:hypothetical protein [Brevibacillus parabrevis]|nr:hypothetical protein [Brevibacillus parabrevis]